MSEAIDRVRAAIADGKPVDRRSIEHALRDAFGMSARQAKRFAAQGAKALGVEEGIHLEDLAERLSTLERSMRL